MSATASQGLQHPWLEAPAPGFMQAVAEDVYWLRMPLPFRLDHINLYCIRLPHGWVLIDTGLNYPAGRETWEAVIGRYFAERPVVALICTHYHYDHASLAGWLTRRFGCELWMSEAEYYQACMGASGMSPERTQALDAHLRRAGLPAADLAQVHKALGHAGFISDMPVSYRRLRQGDCLTIGDEQWQVLVGSGHAPEHVSLFRARDQLLISGDQLLPRITPTVQVNPDEPWANPMRGWFQSLERMAELPDATLVLPAHELPYRNPRVRARQIIADHQLKLDRLLEHCEQPATAYQHSCALFPRALSGIDVLMALGETLAHLHLLAYDQLLLVDDRQFPTTYVRSSDPARALGFRPLDLSI